MFGKGKEYEKALAELHVPDPTRRAQAAVNMGLWGDDSSVEQLRKLVNDASEHVRVSAFYGMCVLGDKESVTKLIPYVGHDRPLYRKLAFAALAAVSGITPPGGHEDAAKAKEAQAQWNKWWNESSKLTWDAKKKIFAQI
jgi:hypothetical protein